MRVLLKRPYKTPRGGFPQSLNGHPTVIDDLTVKMYGLPKDAVAVDGDYVAPEDKVEEMEDVRMTAAQQEAMIERGVAKRLAEQEEGSRETSREVDEGVLDITAEALELLDNSVPIIINALKNLSVDELNDLLKAETAGKTRKSLTIEIEAAIEALEKDADED